MHAALAQCLPPPISLQCLPVAWLPGGLVELEVTGGLLRTECGNEDAFTLLFSFQTMTGGHALAGAICDTYS